ncbi:MAG: DUF4387 family protein [Gammaproteobacteria bacterium]
MSTIGSQVLKVRSKNAGPFWITVDIFCDTDESFESLSTKLLDAHVAGLFGLAPDALQRFDIPGLNVVKFSFPRPVVQGARNDRDMHGAQWALLLEEFELPA